MEDAFDEMELLGFPLCDPFEILLTPSTHKMRVKHLPGFIGKHITIEGYLVTTKHTVTSNGKRMYFGTFLDRDGHFIDTVHFPPTARKYPFRGRGVYQLIGKVMEEFDCISIEINSMKKLDMMQDPRYAEEQIKQVNT